MSMGPHIAPACVACGAPAPAVLAPTTYICTFCQRSQLLEPHGVQRPPAPRALPRAGVPERPIPFVCPPAPAAPVFTPGPPPKDRGRPVASAVVAVLTVVIPTVILGAKLFSVRSAVAPSDPTASLGPGPEVPLRCDVPPVIADVNRDGVEDAVGFYDTNGARFAAVFDGKTMHRTWASPPLVSGTQNSPRFGVAGERVVVTHFRSDLRGEARVYDPKTNVEPRIVPISDRVDFICSPADRRSEVWMQVIDGNHVVVNLETGVATPAPRPAWCQGPAEAAKPTDAQIRALRKQSAGVEWVVRGDGRSVAWASRAELSPQLAAFDSNTMALAWKESVAPEPVPANINTYGPPAVIVYAAGRVYSTYETKAIGSRQGPALYVTGFDVATGKRLFHFKAPAHGNWTLGKMSASSQRIYLPRSEGLDVFDAKDGHYLGMPGKP